MSEGRETQTLEQGSGHEGYMSKASMFHEGVVKEGSSSFNIPSTNKAPSKGSQRPTYIW